MKKKRVRVCHGTNNFDPKGLFLMRAVINPVQILNIPKVHRIKSFIVSRNEKKTPSWYSKHCKKSFKLLENNKKVLTISSTYLKIEFKNVSGADTYLVSCTTVPMHVIPYDISIFLKKKCCFKGF